MTPQCLRDLRRSAGLTQEELAQRIPCATQTVARMEGRTLRPLAISPWMLSRLLDVFEEVAAERRIWRARLAEPLRLR